MKLRLPKSLMAALAIPVALGMAPLAMAEYVSSDGPIAVDLLPALPSTSDGLRSLWIGTKSGWTAYQDNGTGITAAQVTSSLTRNYGLANEGWHFSNNTTENGTWSGPSDIDLLTNDGMPNGFHITGRKATGGEFAMATAGVSSLLAGGAQPSTLTLTFTATTAGNSSPTHVSVWKWDGTNASKLGLVSVDASTTGTTTTLGDLSLAGLQETDKLVFIWFAKDGGTTHKITNLSTTVDQAVVAETLTWTGATTTWSQSSDMSNWQGEGANSFAIGAKDLVVFGATEGNKAVNVVEDISVKAMTVSASGYTFSGDGSITVTDALTVENAAVTIDTGLTLQGTATNNGGQLFLNGSLSVADSGAIESSYSEGLNGYATKTLVKNTNGGTVEIAGNPTSINIGGATYSLVSTAAGVAAQGSEYLVNAGTVVYGGTGEEASEVTTASAITLNGGKLELKAGLSQGTSLCMAVNSTVQIDGDATLSAGEVTKNGHTLTIAGTGTFVNGSGDAVNATLGADWTGTVEVSGIADAAINLNKFGTATQNAIGKSTVRINGVSGWMKVGDGSGKNTYANIDLQNTATAAALKFTDSNADTEYNYYGAFSGTGDLVIEQRNNSTFIFKGDAANWTGAIVHSDRNGASSDYSAILKFEKDGLQLGVNKISHTGAHGTLNVQVTGSGNKLISGALDNVMLTSSGTGDLKLAKAGNVTSATVTNGSLTVADKLTVAGRLAALADEKGVTITSNAGQSVAMALSGDGEGGAAGSGASVSQGATIKHATVSATGISKETGYTTGHGSIENATVSVNGGTEQDKFSISEVDFSHAVLEMAEGAHVSMNDVVIGVGSAVVNNSGNTYTAGNMGLVLTETAVTDGALVLDADNGVVTLHTGVLGVDGELGGNLSLTLTEGFMLALEKASANGVEYTTFKINFGDSISLANVDSVTLDNQLGHPGTIGGAYSLDGSVLTFTDIDPAIPEPATTALSLLALAGLAARRRRK